MSDMKKPINYRGIKQATLLAVVEGDGTNENPYKIVEYVVGFKGGKVQTLGKLVQLSVEEQEAIGKDLTL